MNTKNSKSIGLISSEYTNPVDAITFKIFNIFEVFRANPALNRNEDSTQIVLLLVSLYKDGLISDEAISKDFSITSLKNSISESNLNEKCKRVYLSVIHVLKDSLSNVINNSLNYLGFYLFQIEKELLVEYFPAIFDDVIYRIAQSQARYSAEEIQPIELTRFISGLIDLKPNSSVFNPFGGLASFGLNLTEKQKYYGQEVSESRWIIGILRLLAFGKLANSNYDRADSVEDWPINVNFDYIVSTPPFGMQIDLYDSGSNTYFKTIEHFLIENGIQSLKNPGKLIVAFSQNFLFKGGTEKELRKKLIEKDLIDSIVSFPGGLFQHTAIHFVVLVLSNKKKLQNKVRFIKADNYVIEKNRREKVLHDELLLNVYNSIADFSDDIRLIDNEVLMENDYNLTANRYFEDTHSIAEIPADAQLVNLGELVQTVDRGFTDSQTGIVVSIADLSDSIESFEKNVSDFKTGSISASFQKLESSVLLLSKIRALKPTFCKIAENETVYSNNNIIALSVDETKVYIPYLILELNSERVNKFVKSRLTGISIPSLTKKDIIEIPILLYSLEVQKAKYAGYIEAIAQKKKEELVSFSKIHGLESNIHEQNAYLRHTLAGTVSNLDGTLKNIQSIIESYANQHPDILKMKVSDKHKITLKQYMSNLSRDITKISTTIGKQLKQELSLYDYPKELIDISKFLSNYVTEINESNSFDFLINYIHHENYMDLYVKNGDNDFWCPKIFANKTLLSDLFDNLINNAQKHGFKNIKNRKIEFFLFRKTEDIENPKVRILISNSGNPLPKNFSIGDFSRKGYSVGTEAGEGYGGYYVTEIVKYFDGSINIIDETNTKGYGDDGFVTSFEIEIPVLYDENL